MTQNEKTELANLFNEKLAPLSLKERLNFIVCKYSKTVFTTSLGLEDQVITDAIARTPKSIEIITLQTGRLFPEVLELIKTTKKRYGVDIKEFTPNEKSLDKYIGKYGNNGFYESLELRKKCCFVRKVEPLERALKNADAWITGLRATQSNNRQDIVFAKYDADFDLMKFNPLADFTSEMILQIVEENQIPINPLHKKGYPSIGCEPCTRAIRVGEEQRAGRWWWEQESDGKKECGLHVSQANILSASVLSV